MLSPPVPTKATVISSWELAKKRPAADTLMDLADLFGVSVDYLLGKTDKRTSQPDTFDALEVLAGLFRIDFEGEFEYRGEFAIDSHLVSYWRKIQSANTAAQRMGLAPEILDRILKGFKEEHAAALCNPDPESHKFTRYDFTFNNEYDNLTELLRASVFEKVYGRD